METENKKNTVENAQITFKLANDERQHIEEDAAKFGISISEYCRIKCLLDENEAFTAKTKVTELEKLVTTLRVKLSYYKENERDPNNIVLKLTSKQREMFEKLFSDFSDNTTIEQNIIDALVFFTTFEIIFRDNFSHKGITKAEIQDIFYPEYIEEEEN